jgi:hypothetical protein
MRVQAAVLAFVSATARRSNNLRIARKNILTTASILAKSQTQTVAHYQKVCWTAAGFSQLALAGG